MQQCFDPWEHFAKRKKLYTKAPYHMMPFTFNIHNRHICSGLGKEKWRTPPMSRGHLVDWWKWIWWNIPNLTGQLKSLGSYTSIIFIFIYLMYVYVHAYRCLSVHVDTRGQPWGVGSFFHHVCSRDLTQVFKHGRNTLSCWAVLPMLNLVFYMSKFWVGIRSQVFFDVRDGGLWLKKKNYKETVAWFSIL